MTSAKYLVIKFARISKPVQKQQQMRAEHDVIVEDLTAQTPAYKIERQLIAAILCQHLDTKTQ